MIWAIILAAGESKRMGQAKLLLPFGKTTIIETVVESVISSKVDKTLVVLGSRRRQIKERIGRFPVATTYNPRYRRGMLSSVIRGLEALPHSGEAAVVVLADLPGVPTSVIDSLIEGFRREKKGIIVPVYRKKRGHPFLLDLKYKEEIEHLSPGIGLRELLQRHPEDIFEVGVSTPAVLRDIDNAEDYSRATKKRKGQAYQ
jgi:molybdenum cofactor cytidylyltransferase